MGGYGYYVATLAIYFGIDTLAAWALNLEYGDAGIPNFAFIVFQAIGAYIVAVLSLGPQSANGGFQHYILGASLPFPVPFLLASLAGALLGLAVGYVTVMRLRRDLQAIILFVLAVIASEAATNITGLFNGSAGLALIPQPLASKLNLSTQAYDWFYVGLVAVAVALGWLFFRRITESPLGRAWRASRDGEAVAAALGKNVRWLRLLALMVGGAIAALSGALLASFIGVWSPGAWTYQETIVYLGCLFVGGIGNRLGVMLGALLLPVGLAEATRYLPPIGGEVGLTDAVQWMVTGAVILLFLWFKPTGLIPEKPRRVANRRSAKRASTPVPLRSGDWRAHARAGALTRPWTLAVDRLPSRRSSGRRLNTEDLGGDAHDAQTPALAVTNLRCQYGGVVAVDDVSFVLPTGSIMGLIGPNGAGKSTLLSAITGRTRAKSGVIMYRGRNLCGMQPFQISRLGIIHTFQIARELPRLTVMENLLVGAPENRGESFLGALKGPRYWGAYEETAVQRARALLERAGMLAYEDKFASALSGGQKRLLELMRALMAEPAILLLDEPFAGISPALAITLMDYLEQLRDAGMTILLTEHELSVVERLCDSVLVLAQGGVVAEGHMRDLRMREEVISAYMSG